MPSIQALLKSKTLQVFTPLAKKRQQQKCRGSYKNQEENLAEGLLSETAMTELFCMGTAF